MEKVDHPADSALADRLAIIELCHRYSFAIDTRDWSAFRRLFTEDVVAEFIGHRTWTDLETWATYFEKSHGEMAGTQHLLSNEIVEVDGDRARLIFYGLVRTCMPREVANDRQLGVWYDDDVIRTADGWRISRHTCRPVSHQELHESIISEDPPWKVAERGEIRFLAANQDG
jgi:hypothetical protein